MTKKCPILLLKEREKYLIPCTAEDCRIIEDAKERFGDCLEEKCAWWRKEAFDEKYEHGTKRIYSGHCAILDR